VGIGVEPLRVGGLGLAALIPCVKIALAELGDTVIPGLDRDGYGESASPAALDRDFQEVREIYFLAGHARLPQNLKLDFILGVINGLDPHRKRGCQVEPLVLTDLAVHIRRHATIGPPEVARHQPVTLPPRTRSPSNSTMKSPSMLSPM